MRLTLALFFTLLSACADLNPHKASYQTGSFSTDERQSLYDQALEGARLSRERYIATTRPALQLKFRQEYPTMTEADIEVLVNDALEKGLRPETGRRPDGPIRQPQMDCMSSPWRNSAFANCY
ncbi:MAG: hypothetical protein KF722_09485 [Nitrospira sp.]|nr:hypothetical protein [Nitrospira sp.]